MSKELVDRNLKVHEFIRRDVLAFMVGMVVASLLSYAFHWGNWVVKTPFLVLAVLLVGLIDMYNTGSLMSPKAVFNVTMRKVIVVVLVLVTLYAVAMSVLAYVL